MLIARHVAERMARGTEEMCGGEEKTSGIARMHSAMRRAAFSA